MHPNLSHDVAKLVQSLTVVMVEDNSFSQKVQRGLLAHIGVKTIHEAADGASGLEAIRRYEPDLVILDWNLPILTGAELARMIRSPRTFPRPDVPIIMLTLHSERWRVVQAQRLGVNEFLVKPLSAQTLLERIVSIFMHPRPIVQWPNYYGPEPRGVLAQYLQGQTNASTGTHPAACPRAEVSPAQGIS
jgi:two-component system, chemotaxis family, chemotaxis protein CheY